MSMTWNPFFFRFFRGNSRRWLGPAVLSLYLCIMFLLDFSMAQQQILFIRGDGRIGPGNAMAFLITIIMGVVCAFWGFGFLFSEKKTDFYLGLPINRSTLFETNYISGILVGVVPCILSRFVCLFLEERIGGDSVGLVVSGMMVTLLGFLLVYNGCICIICLTGKFAAAAAGLVFVWGYGAIVVTYLAEKYSSVFFRTFYRIDVFDSLKMYLSPIQLYGSLAGVNDGADPEIWNMGEKGVFLIVTFLAVLALGGTVPYTVSKKTGRGSRECVRL